MNKRYQVSITIKPRIPDIEIDEDIKDFIEFAKGLPDVEVVSVPSPYAKEILIDTTNKSSAGALRLMDLVSRIKLPGVVVHFNYNF